MFLALDADNSGTLDIDELLSEHRHWRKHRRLIEDSPADVAEWEAAQLAEGMPPAALAQQSEAPPPLMSTPDSSGSVQAAAYTTQSEDGEHVRAAEDLQPVRAKRSHILSEQLGVLNEVSRLMGGERGRVVSLLENTLPM